MSCGFSCIIYGRILKLICVSAVLFSLACKVSVNKPPSSEEASQASNQKTFSFKFGVSDSLFPTSSLSPPLVQGTSYTLLTAVVSSPTGSITVSCTYKSVGLSSSDQNYAASGTDCSNLPSLKKVNGVTFLDKAVLQDSTFSWTPTYTQRGTFQFDFVATDGKSFGTKSLTVSVREGYSTSKLLMGLDALVSDFGTGAVLGSVPAVPRLTENSNNNKTGLFTSTVGALSGDLAGFTSTFPYAGSGQASLSLVDPYGLSFNSANSDSMALGSALGNSSRIGIQAWVKPSSVTTAGSTIVGNGGGSLDGFAIRQSNPGSGRAEFVVGKKFYSYRDLVLSDNPVGYWRLDDTSGASPAKDWTSYINHGTYNGTYTQNSAGALFEATKSTFFTTDGYVNIPDQNQYSSSTFSLESWIKWDGTTFAPATSRDWSAIISKGTYNSGEYTILMSRAPASANTFNFYINGAMRATWSTTMDTSWHHLVATYDGAAAKIYFDGAEKVSTNVVVAVPNSVNAVRLGGETAGTYFWGGNLDDSAIYAYPLSATQVIEHYQTGVAGNYKAYPGNAILADKPLGYWRLSEKAGSTAYDFSGNGYHGTYGGNYRLGQAGALAADPVSSAYFDASTNTVVTLPAGLTIPANNPVTVEYWTYVPTPFVNGSSFTLGNQNDPNRAQAHAPASDSFLSWDFGNSPTTRIATNYTAYGNQWAHVALVAREGYRAIYINGNLITSGTPAGMNSSVLTGGYIGGCPVFGTYWHKGRIQDFAVYNYPLSPTQISNHYSGTAWWICQSQSVLANSKWNMLSALYEGGIAKLFVNGIQECSVTPGTTFSSTAASTYVGSTPPTKSNFWSGVLGMLNISGTSDGSSPITATSIKSDFDATSNRFRSIAMEPVIADSSLVFHLDAANAKQGIGAYAAGCASSDTAWFDLSPQGLMSSLIGFSGCAGNGWAGTGTAANPYQLILNGSSNYVKTGFTQSSVTAQSMEMWVKTADSGNSRGIFQSRSTYASGEGGKGLAFTLDAGQLGYIVDSDSLAIGLRTTGTINNGVWRHVVGTWAATSGTAVAPAQFKIYVDGSTSTTASVAAGAVNSPLTGSSLSLIGRHYDWNTWFNGSIAVFRIYNRVLTPEEVKQNCIAQKARFSGAACASP